MMNTIVQMMQAEKVVIRVSTSRQENTAIALLKQIVL